jgi:DNA polymerase-1
VVIGGDYNQGELRVIACIANESTMIAAYRDNMDLHALTAGRFSGYTYQEMMVLSESDPKKFKAIRQLGKAGNFGLIYGMGIDGFLIYAASNYGVDLEYEAGAAFHSGFFATSRRRRSGRPSTPQCKPRCRT